MIGRRLQQYLIVEKAGEGGMGVVWKARDTRLDRDVALKVLPERTADDIGRERFAREAKSASALNHPNIVTIYEIDSDAGVDFIAMEFIRGETLAQWLERGPLEIPVAIAYATQVADAVACAHQAGIIHRDLKPGNIMIASTGALKVLDFGLAKPGALQSDTAIAESPTFAPLTVVGLAVGTLDYMSPEQSLGEPVDARSDVFSFGAVLYQMLTARRPFAAETRAEVLRRIHFSPPPPIETIRSDVPPALAAVVAKALEKRPEDRYASMSDVKHALTHLDDAPARAAASVQSVFPAFAHLWRTRRRQRRRLLVVVAIAASVAWSAWTLYRQVRSAPAAPVSSVPDAPMPQTPYELSQRAAQLLQRFDRQGNVDNAIAQLEGALKVDQNYALAHAYLSEAYRRKHLTNPDPQWVRLSTEAARRALELNTDLAVAHMAQGYIDLDAAHYADAEAHFRRAADLDPLSPLPHIALAYRFVAEKRDAEAEAALHKAVALKGDDWRPDSELADFRFRRGRYAEAAAGWESARKIAPDNFLVLRSLGAALHMSGRSDEAAASFQRALEIRPTASVYTNLGTVRFYQGRYADAVTAFEKAVDLGANSSLNWGNLADAYRWAPGRRGDSTAPYGRAIALVRQDLEKKPGDVDLTTRLATYLAKNGDTAAARETIARIDETSQLTPQVLYRLTIVNELTGDRARALASLDRALKAGYPLKEVSNEPELTELRADARYHRLIASLPTP